jgi:23S rRNA (cytosine1962-C5)-methyltransferase
MLAGLAFEPFTRPFRDARVLADANGLLVVDKPAGIPVHGGDEALEVDLVSRLAAWLEARGRDRYLGVHQRLDEDTSGVLVFTTARERNVDVARALGEHRFHRRYVAGVSLNSPRLVARLAEGPQKFAHRLDTQGALTRVVAAGGVEASAVVRLLERAGERALVELEPDTGRTHQLRATLAHEGAPVAGDKLYGGTAAPRLLLHASELGFGSERFHSPVPAAFRGWTLGEAPKLGDAAALASELADAAILRAPLARFTDAYRLANEEGDLLPGVTIDRYGDYAVLQVASSEAERRAPELAALLLEGGARGVYLKIRAKGDARRRPVEHAPSEPIAGEPAPPHFSVCEHGMNIEVELGQGLSTGLFLDQRENRRRVRARAHGARVLNLFSYTSSFGVAAALGGATEVVNIDQSRRALERSRENFALNGLDASRHAFLQRDAVEWLVRARRDRQEFDLVILDPPSFASSADGLPFNVTKRYGAVAERALALLAPGGSLLAVTNHRATSAARFRRILRDAAETARVPVVQLKDLASQLDCPDGPDGPVPSKSVLLTRR